MTTEMTTDQLVVTGRAAAAELDDEGHPTADILLAIINRLHDLDESADGLAIINRLHDLDADGLFAIYGAAIVERDAARRECAATTVRSSRGVSGHRDTVADTNQAGEQT